MLERLRYLWRLFLVGTWMAITMVLSISLFIGSIESNKVGKSPLVPLLGATLAGLGAFGLWIWLRAIWDEMYDKTNEGGKRLSAVWDEFVSEYDRINIELSIKDRKSIIGFLKECERRGGLGDFSATRQLIEKHLKEIKFEEREKQLSLLRKEQEIRDAARERQRQEEILLAEEEKRIRKKEKAALRRQEEKERAERVLRADERVLRAIERAEEILLRQANRVKKFFELAYRDTTKVNDYNEVDPRALDGAIFRFLQQISRDEPLISASMSQIALEKNRLSGLERQEEPWEFVSTVLKELFHNYCEEERKKVSGPSRAAIDTFSGSQFEEYLIKLLKDFGVDEVSGTKKTRDQGADILFTFQGLRIVIQAKRHSQVIASSAVQQAHTAKAVYDCDEAWVVTNSYFSNDAKMVARKIGVTLFDGGDLSRFKTKFEEYFSKRITSQSS